MGCGLLHSAGISEACHKVVEITHASNSEDSGGKSISLSVRLTYGFGAVAYGIKDLSLIHI